MEFLQSLLDSSTTPIVSAVLLGLLTAVSPCPLATNITAIGFIGRNIESRHRVFWNGILYTLGRVIAYSALGLVLIPIVRQGASMFAIQKAISRYGELLIAPLLVLIGIYLLDVIRLNLPSLRIGGDKLKERSKGTLGALLLGLLFALAFCPSSGFLFFGMLIPLSAAEAGGYWLPVAYALATGLPVVLVAWMMAYSIQSVGRFYSGLQQFERWFKRGVGVLFIAVGIYYGFVFYL